MGKKCPGYGLIAPQQRPVHYRWMGGMGSRVEA
jgi:hypothetical protein